MSHATVTDTDENTAAAYYAPPLFVTMIGAVLTILVITAPVGIPVMCIGLLWTAWSVYNGPPEETKH